MDCQSYEDLLDALLDGRITAAERRALDAHASVCPRCREMLSLVSMEIEAADVRAPEGLTEAVLERTSGAPCASAVKLLCDLVDGTLGEPDAELVRIHLGGCRTCRSIAAALARLREELPLLAEIRPDERFVDAVLSRTSRGWRRTFGWRGSFDELLRRLLARPRFAAEGAYLGSILLTMLVAFPGSPLSGLPERALTATRTDVLERIAVPASPMEALGARVSALRADARQELSDATGAVLRLEDRVVRFVGDLGGHEHETKNESTTPARQDDTKETRP
ncbi:MAG: zf-HC2 domain-containing protein [Acidobacteriia bacterium]|nr:zf-HC2 domain-containing protein [Terriglobia bacterium]